MNLLCYPLCLSGIEKTWMKCLIAGSRSLFRITWGFIGSFKQLSKNQCNTARLFFKIFFKWTGFLDLKEIKLNSNPIWWLEHCGLSLHPRCFVSVNPLLYFMLPYHFSFVLHVCAYFLMYYYLLFYWNDWILSIYSTSRFNLGLASFYTVQLLRHLNSHSYSYKWGLINVVFILTGAPPRNQFISTFRHFLIFHLQLYDTIHHSIKVLFV